MENKAYIGLGGNIGDPRSAMARALRLLNTVKGVAVRRVSSIYRTPPWGKTDQPDFLNAAAELETTLTPRELLDLCLETELALKRIRAERWGPRIIDIDILKFGEEAIVEKGLEIPHPRMLDRAFVLLPLAEIAPQLDLSGDTAHNRAMNADKSGIEKLAVELDWWLQ
ncbi:MAG: 2-amino-4-hydroxy-6-hydroxymethyldihydropteridine diphosphokinase [Rhizobiaceae bacterium]|nr:2-amino-4-hydroxy-6-hydroxymethyldihydropteridine diphosphokinase [Rhizobiaceae bacterium]